jgi:hypothetical protein
MNAYFWSKPMVAFLFFSFNNADFLLGMNSVLSSHLGLLYKRSDFLAP